MAPLIDVSYRAIGLPLIADFLLQRLHSPDLSLHDVQRIAYCALRETTQCRPTKVGKPFRFITITPEHGCEEVPDGAVEALDSESRLMNPNL